MVESVIDLPSFLAEIGKLGNWLRALGLVVLISVIFEIIAFLMNQKRLKEIERIKKDMARIERKIDNLSVKR